MHSTENLPPRAALPDQGIFGQGRADNERASDLYQLYIGAQVVKY